MANKSTFTKQECKHLLRAVSEWGLLIGAKPDDEFSHEALCALIDKLRDCAGNATTKSTKQ